MRRLERIGFGSLMGTIALVAAASMAASTAACSSAGEVSGEDAGAKPGTDGSVAPPSSTGSGTGGGSTTGGTGTTTPPTGTPDASTTPDAKAPDASIPAVPGYKLTWHDEFDGAAIDGSKWAFDTGAGGWGNGELQYHTDRAENAFVSGGYLNIRAMKGAFTGPKGSADYTSARLITRGKFDQKLGRFEAKIKLPSGQGIWPAFWMLGSDIVPSGWPSCGEIDIMENVGKQPEQALAYGTIHGPDQDAHDYYGGAGIGSKYQLPTGRFADGFHTFRVDWEPGVIRFFVDDKQTVDKTTGLPKDLKKTDLPSGWRWVFDDHAFFMILNVAVGGAWPGNPDGTTQFPQTMQVEYVRVYAKE